MQITLSTQQSKIIEALSHQGQYASLEVAIDVALLLLAEKLTEQNTDLEPDYLEWMEETRLKIDEGVQDVEAGRLVDIGVVLSQLQNKVQLAQAKSA